MLIHFGCSECHCGGSTCARPGTVRSETFVYALTNTRELSLSTTRVRAGRLLSLSALSLAIGDPAKYVDTCQNDAHNFTLKTLFVLSVTLFKRF